MEIWEKEISRKEFLKKTAMGAAVAALFGKVELAEAAGGMTFTDNIRSGVVIGANPPVDTQSLWVDTGKGGIAKFYNGNAWVPTKATWG